MTLSTSGAIAAAVFLLALGMIGGYLLGYRAGRRDGHAQGLTEGKEATKREVSIKAFAAGFERGKLRAAEQEAEGTQTRRSGGCAWLVLAAISLFVWIAW
jgi:hypothetical protein